jgi:hypothetical protein
MIDSFLPEERKLLCSYFGLKEKVGDDVLDSVLRLSREDIFIKSLYISILGRPLNKIDSDVEGINNWINNLKKMSRETVIKHLKKSGEYKKLINKEIIFLGPYKKQEKNA